MLEKINFDKDATTKVSDLTEKIVKQFPVKQDKFTPLTAQNFYWFIRSQCCRQEVGIPHHDLKTPKQLRNAACDRFWKLNQENHPYIRACIEKKISSGEITDAASFCIEQRKCDTPAMSPAVECMANYLNIDMVILDTKSDTADVSKLTIRGSLSSDSTSDKPPFICDRMNGVFQSFIPLDGAGPQLNMLKTWKEKDIGISQEESMQENISDIPAPGTTTTNNVQDQNITFGDSSSNNVADNLTKTDPIPTARMASTFSTPPNTPMQKNTSDIPLQSCTTPTTNVQAQNVTTGHSSSNNAKSNPIPTTTTDSTFSTQRNTPITSGQSNNGAPNLAGSNQIPAASLPPTSANTPMQDNTSDIPLQSGTTTRTNVQDQNITSDHSYSNKGAPNLAGSNQTPAASMPSTSFTKPDTPIRCKGTELLFKVGPTK